MIKNYTSTVPVDRTISRIESLLVQAGAKNIMKDYEGGRLNALCFTVMTPDNRNVSVRLPAKVDAVYDTLVERVKRSSCRCSYPMSGRGRRLSMTC